jgi:hypothetical protein
MEEMLFLKLLTTTMNGLSAFETIENFFVEKIIPLTNVIACATDGAPAIVGQDHCFYIYCNFNIPIFLCGGRWIILLW